MHGLNEKLGRHREKNGRTEFILCGNECESAVNVLWECPVYKDKREGFMVKLRNIFNILGEGSRGMLEEVGFGKFREILQPVPP